MDFFMPGALTHAKADDSRFGARDLPETQGHCPAEPRDLSEGRAAQDAYQARRGPKERSVRKIQIPIEGVLYAREEQDDLEVELPERLIRGQSGIRPVRPQAIFHTEEIYEPHQPARQRELTPGELRRRRLQLRQEQRFEQSLETLASPTKPKRATRFLGAAAEHRGIDPYQRYPQGLTPSRELQRVSLYMRLEPLLPYILLVFFLLLLIIFYRVLTRPLPSKAPVYLSSASSELYTPSSARGFALETDQAVRINDSDLSYWPERSSVASVHQAQDLLLALKGRERSPQALQGVTVILDPQDGGIKSGATHPRQAPYDLEAKHLNLQFSQVLGQELQKLGASVRYTRSEDEWLADSARAALIAAFAIERDLPAIQAMSPLNEHGEAEENWAEDSLEKLQEVRDRNQDRAQNLLFHDLGSTLLERQLLDLERQQGDVIVISVGCRRIENKQQGGVEVSYLSNKAHLAQEKALTREVGQKREAIYQYYPDHEREQLAQVLLRTILKNDPSLRSTQAHQPDDSSQNALIRDVGMNAVEINLGDLSLAEERKRLLDSDRQEALAASVAQAVYLYYSQALWQANKD